MSLLSKISKIKLKFIFRGMIKNLTKEQKDDLDNLPDYVWDIENMAYEAGLTQKLRKMLQEGSEHTDEIVKIAKKFEDGVINRDRRKLMESYLDFKSFIERVS